MKSYKYDCNICVNRSVMRKLTVENYLCSSIHTSIHGQHSYVSYDKKRM